MLSSNPLIFYLSVALNKLFNEPDLNIILRLSLPTYFFVIISMNLSAGSLFWKIFYTVNVVSI